MKFKIIQDSENFFEIKTKAQKLFSKSLDEHPPAKDFQLEFETFLIQMLKIAEIHNALYFIERIHAIQFIFEELKKSDFHNRSLVLRINSLFSKIQESEIAYFLNSLLNKKLERLVRKNFEIMNNKQNIFYVLSFQNTLIVVPKVKKKILSNVEYSKKYISINHKKFRIFPMYPLKVEYPEEMQELSNILILKSGDESICVRFDSGLAEVYFDSMELQERKIDTFSKYEDLRYFLKWRGRNCFYLDFISTSSYLST